MISSIIKILRTEGAEIRKDFKQKFNDSRANLQKLFDEKNKAFNLRFERMYQLNKFLY